MKTYLRLLCCFLLVAPVFAFLLSYVSVCHFPLIYLPPFSSLFPLSSIFNPSLAPLSSLFHLSSPSFSTQSSIYFSVSEHFYRDVRVNGVPVSSTGQVMNLSPLWSPVTRSSFITRLSGGRTEWDGDQSVQVQVSMERPPYRHFISL